ncbi:MAG: tetratricopeptide repeat protein [Flavisolibacter sp.]
MPLDSARLLTQTAKGEEKLRAMRRLDRHYYTTGFYDSSIVLQKEMYALARQLKSDSLMYLTLRAIGNRFTTKTDYNFGLENYFDALNYAKTNTIKSGLYQNIAYVYTVTENTEVALSYLRKADALGVTNFFFQNLLYGTVYNSLQNPDSALFYLKRCDENDTKSFDATVYAILPTQMGKAYELKGDTVLARAYYEKAINYCRKEKIASAQIRHGNVYCDFLLRSGNYEEARQLALENLAVARKTRINEGISNVAEILRKVYMHMGNKDSIIYYAQMQIDYRDSVTNQKRIAEFQNITFAQQLKDIDEQSKINEAKEKRKHNIQYAVIGLGIIIFTSIFLLLSRSIIVNEKWIEFLGVLGLLVVFEFINLLIHPYVSAATNDSPIFMLVILVVVAALLIPLHHRLERWIKEKMVEKNRKIRLEAARKTIEKLEKKSETV